MAISTGPKPMTVPSGSWSATYSIAMAPEAPGMFSGMTLTSRISSSSVARARLERSDPPPGSAWMMSRMSSLG
ncbi:hypothetical protein [Serinicoccus marinus]|uniref:hypothetical protein n=1 Tax=Serinicoccus marinus TaxID=247333 RepID=UPI001EE81D12|nr:hypothetical protein [Serinicoccus marinus]